MPAGKEALEIVKRWTGVPGKKDGPVANFMTRFDLGLARKSSFHSGVGHYYITHANELQSLNVLRQRLVNKIEIRKQWRTDTEVFSIW